MWFLIRMQNSAEQPGALREASRRARLRFAATSLLGLLTLLPLRADISVSGDYDPTDASFWTAGLNPAESGTIGVTADGTLTVEDGSLLSLTTLWLGQDAGVTGTATFTGSGSSFIYIDDFIVGENGIGYLDILAGAQVTGEDAYIGYNPGSSGEAIVSGPDSQWNATGIFVIGDEGTAELRIEDGGYVSADYAGMGRFSTGDGTTTVTDSSSELDITEDLYVGDANLGSLTIENGGQVTVGNDGFIGYQTDSDGTAVVDGSGSRWDLGDDLQIGRYGSGELTVRNGGVVTNSGDGTVGDKTGGVGTVTVDGSDSRWEVGDNLEVGYDGTGTLTIRNGGTVTSVEVARIAFGSGGDGTLNVTGTDSLLDLASDLEVGSAGIGRLNVTDGATVQGNDGIIGVGTEATGMVTIDGSGSSWQASDEIFVGFNGAGTLRIENGGTLSSSVAWVGTNSGSTGTVEIRGSGSQWTTTSDLSVGAAGEGSLLLVDGGSVRVGLQSYIGNSAGGVGTVTIRGSGSEWVGSQNLQVGNDGAGTLNLSEGARVLLDWDLKVNSASSLNAIIDGNSVIQLGLDPGVGVGDFTNDGQVNLIAGAALAAGTYEPIQLGTAGSFNGSGETLGVGGSWNSVDGTFTVSAITSDGTGDLSARRVDYAGGLVVGFRENAGSLSFDVTQLGTTEINGFDVLGAYEFDTTLTELTALSFMIGSGYDAEVLKIWHLAEGASTWTPFETDLFDYTGDYYTFTTDQFSSYAVTVPEPSTVALLAFVLSSGVALWLHRRLRGRA